ncbi:MAG: glutamine amidotransferase-related protein [Candidatus Zipacnadales bacterium]
MLVRYKNFNPRLLGELSPTAIVMSGFGRSFETFDRRHLIGVNDAVKRAQVPILGICGSHQLNAMFFNQNIRTVTQFEDMPMRKLKPGEPDLQPAYHPGYFKESGFHPIYIVQNDPLFRGFRRSFMCLESHYCEVKRLPKEFMLLASTDECKIQAYRHQHKPLYGVQFHPEAYTDYYPDGKRLLENFFRLAGTRRFRRPHT